MNTTNPRRSIEQFNGTSMPLDSLLNKQLKFDVFDIHFDLVRYTFHSISLPFYVHPYKQLKFNNKMQIDAFR